MKTTKKIFSRAKKIFEIETIIELLIKIIKTSQSKKRQIDVYTTVVFILKQNQNKNIEMYHKSLIKKLFFSINEKNRFCFERVL